MSRFLKDYLPNETNNLLSKRDFKQNKLLFTISAPLKLDVVPNSPENIIFQPEQISQRLSTKHNDNKDGCKRVPSKRQREPREGQGEARF